MMKLFFLRFHFFVLWRRLLLFNMFDEHLFSLLLRQKSSTMNMPNRMLRSIPQYKTVNFCEFWGSLSNISHSCSSICILDKANNFRILLFDLIEIAFLIKDDFQIKTSPGNMYLIIPEDERHKRQSIKFLIIFHHIFDK